MTLIDQSLAAAVTEEVAAGIDSVVDLRRAIHREPEVGLDNPSTQGRIIDALEGLPLEVRRGEGGLTSVVADLRGGEGPTVLLRADTDALPMTEDTELAFASSIPGRAHACGHDAHVAMLVGAARVLSARRHELAGTVRFMFQPGEEGYGGAKLMIEQGVLDGVESAYALHVAPNSRTGTVASRAGTLLASADSFVIDVIGRGGHGSMPHHTVDPIPVAAHLITAVQTMVTREIHIFEPTVVSVTKIESGTTHNVIPDRAQLTGTIRCLSQNTRTKVHAALERLTHAITAAHGATASVTIEPGYPVTVNHEAPVELAAGVARSMLGPDAFKTLPTPVMAAEDFSYVLERVPGAMSMLGVCPEDVSDPELAPACHSTRMRINEAAMAGGVAMHVGTALAALDQPRVG